MVKRIEKLSELESMLCQVGRLGCGNTLVNNVGSPGSRQPEFPNFVAVFAGKIFCQFSDRNAVGQAFAKLVRIKAALAEDVGGAHYRILRIRAGLTFEAQRFFEIE